jgi:adenylate cyclase, class 2
MAFQGMEVEAKVRLEGGSDALRERLRKAGWLRGSLQVQEDIYFTHPDRDFRARGEALRLRREGGVLELTFKGPRQDAGDLKAREETTVRLRDDPRPLLSALGYVEAASVRKRRESWTSGQVTVCVDFVDGLGEFAEVEVLSDPAQAKARIEATLAMLKLDKAPLERASYLELLHAK